MIRISSSKYTTRQILALLRSSRIIPQEVFERSNAIVREVAATGDAALAKFALQFEGSVPDKFRVPESRFEEAGQHVGEELRDALRTAAGNIEKFHRAQMPGTIEVHTAEGVLCRREWRPIDAVGLYVPGGSAPLVSTVLMLGIPARIAGCRDIVLCTPARKGGTVPPEILVAARMVGVKNIFQIGGAQAIAAMAIGTESVPQVRKIFGPGNQYVAAAKSIISQPPYGVAVDMFAGPSELMILADESADPAWVAADLLSQAEHGIDSPVVLLSGSEKLIDDVEAAVSVQMRSLSRRVILGESMKKSHAILADTISQALEIANEYAPEHLILAVKEPDRLIPDIRNAGSVFIGSLTSVVFGDYASGTNHTLPTSGAAASMGGLTVESFMKPLSFQTIDREGFAHLASVVKVVAHAEGLDAHINAIAVREGSV